MTIKIVLRKDKVNKHGLCPMVIQISKDKEVARIPLGFSLQEKDFDKETETVLKRNSEYKKYNLAIKEVKDKIEFIKEHLQELEKRIFDFPEVATFKELYQSEADKVDSTMEKLEKEYGLQITEHHNIVRTWEPRAKLEMRVPISKYGIAREIIKKLIRNEQDPLIDEAIKSLGEEEHTEEMNHFLAAWEKYNKYCILEKRPNTSSRIQNFLNILKSFTQQYKIPLVFESFTEEFGLEFKHYLLNEHYNYLTDQKGVSNGTVHNIQKSVAAFLNWAFKKGLSKNVEFKKWITKKPKTELQYLTEPQLKKLRKFQLPKGGSLDKSRDVWLFSAYSGMRCGDIKNWIPSYVSKEGVIKYQSEKTRKKCVVGLNDVTRSILKKYKGDLPKQNAGLLNKNIKSILKKLGYDKININRIISKGTEDIVHVMPLCDAITMHSAKRSFINLMISKGTQIAHLSTMIGNDIGSLMVYYKSDTSQIKKVMDGIKFS